MSVGETTLRSLFPPIYNSMLTVIQNNLKTLSYVKWLFFKKKFNSWLKEIKFTPGSNVIFVVICLVWLNEAYFKKTPAHRKIKGNFKLYTSFKIFLNFPVLVRVWFFLLIILKVMKTVQKVTTNDTADVLNWNNFLHTQNFLTFLHLILFSNSL